MWSPSSRAAEEVEELSSRERCRLSEASHRSKVINILLSSNEIISPDVGDNVNENFVGPVEEDKTFRVLDADSPAKIQIKSGCY